MNMEKVIASLNDCNSEELERLNDAVQEARLNLYRRNYPRIASYIEEAFQQIGEAGYGLIVRDSYANDVVLYPSELSNETFTIDVFHKADKPKWDDELGIDLTEGEEE